MGSSGGSHRRFGRHTARASHDVRPYLAVLVAAIVAASSAIAGRVAPTAPLPQIFKTPAGRVANVRVERTPGEVVTVSYDLLSDDPQAVFLVSLVVSRDEGKTFDLKPKSVSGDVGSGVRPGSGKKIVWQAGKDVENLQMDLFRFNVVTEAGTAVPVAGKPDARRGALAITSVPPGAGVDVDGRRVGVTPITVPDLVAGTHRVTIVREGYLEHSKEVTVETGRTAELTVTLTATPPAGGGSAQTAAAGKSGKGSPLKWVIPVVGGGAAVGVALAAKGGGSTPSPTPTPTPTNGSPVLGSVTISPAIGIEGLSMYSFILASAVDPDGDVMTIVWTYGDGQQSGAAAPPAGLNTTHTYSRAGTYASFATVTDSRGASVNSNSRDAIVRTITGTWASNPFDGQIRTFRLVQNGSQLSGTYENTGLPGTVAPVTGTVQADRSITVNASGGGIVPVTVTGTLAADLNSFTGLVSGGGASGQTLTFTRQ
jgi:hypothetical protein